MQIVNYIVSALILLILVLLFLKATLPRARTPKSVIKELSPKELEHRIKVLAMNSTDLSPRGGGVGVFSAVREIKRFFKRADKCGNAERYEDFERIILSAREEIETAVLCASNATESFLTLPHKNSYPRLYILCRLLLLGSGDDIDPALVQRAMEITDSCSKLSEEETLCVGAMLYVCVIERLSSLIMQSRFLRKMTAAAQKDYTHGRINLSGLKYDTYIAAYTSRLEANEKRKFDAVCFENGIDTSDKIAAFEEALASLAASAHSLTESLSTARKLYKEPPAGKVNMRKLSAVGAATVGILACILSIAAKPSNILLSLIALAIVAFSALHALRYLFKSREEHTHVGALLEFAADYALSDVKVRHERPQTFAVETTERTYEDVGVLDKVSFLIGGDYVSVVGERGGVADFYRKKELFCASKLYLTDGENLAPLSIVPPFVVGDGRVINNAVCGARSFVIETYGAEGGKALKVTARDGNEFTLTLVHVLTEKYALSDAGIFSPITKPMPFIAVGGSATIENNGLRFGSERSDLSYLVTEIGSKEGSATLALYCGYDLESLKRKLKRTLNSRLLERGAVYCRAFSCLKQITPAVCDIASFVLFGRCTYSPEVAAYIDARLPSVMCTVGGETGIDRLYRRLKRLSVLKTLGLKFNVIVVCLEQSEGFGRVRNATVRMFDTLGLDCGGRAVCIDCGDNQRLYEQICEACPQESDIRRVVRFYCPEVRSDRRVSLPLDIPSASFALKDRAVCDDGDSLYIGDNILSAHENRFATESGFGFCTRPDGRGHTYDRESALTGENALLSAYPAEFVLLGENGRVWSASREPLGNEKELYSVQGADKSIYICTSGGLKVEQSICLRSDAKLITVKLYNPRKTARKIDVLMCAFPVLYSRRMESAHALELSRADRGVVATNRLTGKKLFLLTDGDFDCAFSLETVTGERGSIVTTAFIGERGKTKALLVKRQIRVRPASQAQVSFALTESATFDFSRDEPELLASPLTLKTGIKKTDVLSAYLKQHVRAELYCTGAMGEHFAEPLIKCAALLPAYGKEFRKLILESCRKRFTNGDILLYRRFSDGERATQSGAALFLPLAVARYIDCTDDRDILFERVAYLESGELRSRCRISDKRASVEKHCLDVLLGMKKDRYSRCFGIDSALLALRAISVFLPLVKDGEYRLALAELKAELIEEAAGLDKYSLPLIDLAWLVISGADTGIDAMRLMRTASGVAASERLWACAALLKKGELAAAAELFDSLNPFGGGCDFSDMTEIMPALELMLVTEGFFGLKVRGDTLVMSPSLPPSLKRASFDYNDGKSKFTVHIDNTGSGKWRVSSGGIAYSANSIVISPALSEKKLGLKRR